MFYFNQTITPAAKSHLDAQLLFFGDMSKTLFRCIQKISELNLQLAQTFMEETAQAGRELLTAHKPTELLSVSAAQAQPAVEKIRAYQQNLARIAADVQVDWAKCAEEHGQETCRTAKALADEVVKAATEETDKVRQRHQEAMHKLTDPINALGSGEGAVEQRAPGIQVGVHGDAVATAVTQAGTRQATSTQPNPTQSSGKQGSSPRRDA